MRTFVFEITRLDEKSIGGAYTTGVAKYDSIIVTVTEETEEKAREKLSLFGLDVWSPSCKLLNR